MFRDSSATCVQHHQNRSAHTHTRSLSLSLSLSLTSRLVSSFSCFLLLLHPLSLSLSAKPRTLSHTHHSPVTTNIPLTTFWRLHYGLVQPQCWNSVIQSLSNLIKVHYLASKTRLKPQPGRRRGERVCVSELNEILSSRLTYYCLRRSTWKGKKEKKERCWGNFFLFFIQIWMIRLSLWTRWLLIVTASEDKRPAAAAAAFLYQNVGVR